MIGSHGGIENDGVCASTAPDSVTKRQRQLEALDRVLQAVNSVHDLDVILNIAVDSVMDVIDGCCAAILLTDREPCMLYHRVYRGLSGGCPQEARIPLGEGITGMVARAGETVLIEDVSRDIRASPRELSGLNGMRGFICAPIKRWDDMMGAIMIASDETGKFDSDDARILTSVGDCLATAVIKTVVERKISKGMGRYQALLKHALQAQEDERKRLARELHDETSQTLASVTFRLQAAIQMADTMGFGDSKFRESLRKAHSSAEQAGNEIVRLMMDLRPTLLDDLGMPAAIYRYAKDALESKGINVSMVCIGREHRLPTEVEVAFFRVAQGLVSNVLKHSHARNVSIRVECDIARALLCVEDDGSGFDADKITEIEPNGRGAGLFTMRERLRLVGGASQIESSPGHGTRITVKVPIVKNLGDLANEQDKGLDRR
jgi:signal transduction histidine kinase